ncbi:MAG: efflux RND transporter periplasmic adaptor subunit [Gammaproteobacteria bacterium]
MIRHLHTVSGYLFGVLGLVMLGGCSDPIDHEGLKESNHQSDNHPAIPVEQSRIPRLFISPGNVIASRELMVSSTISGFIQKIAVEEGDHVDAGALLVRIDPSRVKRGISQAEASVAAAQAELKDADDDVRKFHRLAASKSISDDSLRKGVLRREKVRADLRKAQAELQAQQAELKYIEITSPVSGQVVKRFMSAGDISTPGNPILYLESLQGMKFETYVPEKFLVQLKTGGKVMIEMDTLKKKIEGEIVAIVQSIDPVTRSGKIKILLPGSIEAIPGMFGRASFTVGFDTLLTVPESSIISRAGVEGVFVVTSDSNVRFVSVRTGFQWKDQRVILAGLRPDDRVLTEPANATFN